MVVILSLRSSAPHAESRRAPNEGARSIPYKQCVPLCVKKGSQALRHMVRTTVQLVLDHYPRKGPIVASVTKHQLN